MRTQRTLLRRNRIQSELISLMNNHTRSPGDRPDRPPGPIRASPAPVPPLAQRRQDHSRAAHKTVIHFSRVHN
jgi:hypothetical protein